MPARAKRAWEWLMKPTVVGDGDEAVYLPSPPLEVQEAAQSILEWVHRETKVEDPPDLIEITADQWEGFQNELSMLKSKVADLEHLAYDDVDVKVDGSPNSEDVFIEEDVSSELPDEERSRLLWRIRKLEVSNDELEHSWRTLRQQSKDAFVEWRAEKADLQAVIDQLLDVAGADKGSNQYANAEWGTLVERGPSADGPEI